MRSIYTIILFLLLSPGVLLAQYEHIRKPQEKSEIALFKKHKVMGQLQQIVENGAPQSSRARAFDTSGRVVADLSYNRNQYYLYNDKGEVSNYLDSIRTENGFLHNEYVFTYNQNHGKLQEATLPNGRAQLIYNSKEKLLTCTEMINDTVRKFLYYFDNSNNIIKMESYDDKYQQTARFARTYSTAGLLYRQILVEISPDGVDSTLTLSFYNNQRQLEKKQVFGFRTFTLNLENGGETPTHRASQQFVGTYTYTYDKKGNKISENYTSSANKLANYYATWIYNDKGLVTKSTVKGAIGEPQIFVYDYAYFE